MNGVNSARVARTPNKLAHEVAGLEFRVLGSLEVARDNELVPVTAPKQRALLSLPLLRANEPVSHEALSEALAVYERKGHLAGTERVRQASAKSDTRTD
jgi:hypothetical protein